MTTGITPTEIARALSRVIPAELPIYAIDVHLVDNDRVRVDARAGDGWFHGIIPRNQWADKPTVSTP